MTRRTSGLVALALSSLVACFAGGDDDVPGPDSAPITIEQAREGCRIGCQRNIECGMLGTSVDECTDQCVGEFTADNPDWFRGDAYIAIMRCTGELSCNVEMSNCFSECIPTSEHTSFENRCRELFASCGTPPDMTNRTCETQLSATSADTGAGWLCLVVPTIMVELETCFSPQATCESAGSCIQSILDGHGFDL